MTQLFVLNSAYGLATAAAAIDAGLIAGAGPRILLSVNSVQIPETATAISRPFPVCPMSQPSGTATTAAISTETTV